MAESIRVFENSLRDYLIDVQSDAYNSGQKIRYKYNNLKVYMEPRKCNIPHFWVSSNISAACYQIDPLERIDGSMGSDERYILLWASRSNINGELKKHWTYLTNSLELINEQVKDEKSVEENLELSKSEIKEAAEYITGSGLKGRTLKFEKGSEG
jgi:DNA repair exonuclease SbcCD ATPase subunit